jgi:hypothetical protein
LLRVVGVNCDDKVSGKTETVAALCAISSKTSEKSNASTVVVKILDLVFKIPGSFIETPFAEHLF